MVHCTIPSRQAGANQCQPASIPVGAGNRRALPRSGFLSVGSRHRRLPQIDARSVRRYWDMLIEEVFRPIGILHAPAVRTREAPDRDGLVWFNAGFYPTLDDLAKIALLYQEQGALAGRQLLHRELTTDLLEARDAIRKDGDSSLTRTTPENADDRTEFYKMGFHFVPYVGSKSHRRHNIP